MSRELVHIALGGTISMRLVDGLAVPALSAAELARLAELETTPVDLLTVGGPQLTYADLVRTAATIRDAAARGAVGVIVTLGTDAMEEVSAFLAYAGPWSCNVVITGSMEPGGEPGSDAGENLRDAASVARRTQLSEPAVVFAGSVLLARAVVKVSGLARAAFASHSTRSWTVPEVLEAGTLPGLDPAPPVLGTPGPETEEVPMIFSALSLGPPAPAPESVRAPAMICVASGAGSLTPEAAAQAQAALAGGTVVAIATRALDRRMSAGYGYPGGSGVLVAAGAILAAGMSPHQLRMFLLIGLSQGLRGAELTAALRAHVSAL